MNISGDDIAKTVLDQFDKLPNKRKPQIRSENLREWVPLSGIVVQGANSLKCLALATGMKCLPQNKIPQAQGLVLHDWHAEILAIRSLNRFLLEECHALLRSEKQSSEYVRLRTAAEQQESESHSQPFTLNDGLKLHMYCSEAPCGDASMELTMASQEDSSPWTLPNTNTPNPETPKSTSSSSQTSSPPTQPTLHGRGYFSELGITRRKPSRPDAPPTLSKSCSDKLSLKTSTSLLSSLCSLLISPSSCYLTSLTIPSSQYSWVACTRAFGSRLEPISTTSSSWNGTGYKFQRFEIWTTEREFEFCRRVERDTEMKYVSSNLSAAWTANGVEETIIGGVLQGRKQFDVRGASKLCKRRMWKLALEIAESLAGGKARGVVVGGVGGGVYKSLSAKQYGVIKEESKLLDARRRVKRDVRNVALKGWVRNGGDGFEVDGVEY